MTKNTDTKSIYSEQLYQNLLAKSGLPSHPDFIAGKISPDEFHRAVHGRLTSAQRELLEHDLAVRKILQA